jgi:hypothetical protein
VEEVTLTSNEEVRQQADTIHHSKVVTTPHKEVDTTVNLMELHHQRMAQTVSTTAPSRQWVAINMVGHQSPLEALQQLIQQDPTLSYSLSRQMAADMANNKVDPY